MKELITNALKAKGIDVEGKSDAELMDAYNQMVKSLRTYRAQSVNGQGLGGGGRLGVDGGVAPSQTSAPGAAPKKK